jgi:integrase
MKCARLCRSQEWRTASRETWDLARGLKRPSETGLEKWDEKVTTDFYKRVLGEAGRIAQQSVGAGFEESRRRTWEEFGQFVQNVGNGLTIKTMRGMDIIAFVQGVWIPNHRKNFRTVVGPSEEKVASASAIKGVIGQLAKSYSMMGRKDDKNPAKEESVISYREGYRNNLHSRGVREKRAKVMQVMKVKESKVNDQVDYLGKQIELAKGIGKIVLLMDQATILYFWESWARGKECGELKTRQINREDGVVFPGWSKTVREEPSGQVELTRSQKNVTFLAGSAELLAEMARQGISTGRGFLFRALNTSKTGFKDEPLKSGTLKKRIQQHTAKAELFKGETLHSFRRSAVQNAAEIEGYDVAKLMQRGRWSSYSAFRLYIEEIESKFGRRS